MAAGDGFLGRLRRCFWLVACTLALHGCARTPPEERLRQTIAASHHDLEARDAAGLVENVAEDFVGPGGMDRMGLRRTAQGAFLRYRAVGVTLGPMQVDMAADNRHATVRFTAALTGGDGALLPERARLYQVESGWRQTGDAWQLTSLHWTGSEPGQGVP